jgi:hypothetical protein
VAAGLVEAPQDGAVDDLVADLDPDATDDGGVEDDLEAGSALP